MVEYTKNEIFFVCPIDKLTCIQKHKCIQFTVLSKYASIKNSKQPC